MRWGVFRVTRRRSRPCVVEKSAELLLIRLRNLRTFAWSCSIASTSINTTIRVSSTSISGVTLICGPDGPPPAVEKPYSSFASLYFFFFLVRHARVCNIRHPHRTSRSSLKVRALSLPARLGCGTSLSLWRSKLTRKAIIVTGASRGIGAATARLLGTLDLSGGCGELCEE